MSRWDLLTWISVAVLAAGSVLIFVFFLRDLGGVLRGGDGKRDRD
jgi:hypothetical protein